MIRILSNSDSETLRGLIDALKKTKVPINYQVISGPKSFMKKIEEEYNRQSIHLVFFQDMPACNALFNKIMEEPIRYRPVLCKIGNRPIKSLLLDGCLDLSESPDTLLYNVRVFLNLAKLTQQLQDETRVVKRLTDSLFELQKMYLATKVIGSTLNRTRMY